MSENVVYDMLSGYLQQNDVIEFINYIESISGESDEIIIYTSITGLTIGAYCILCDYLENVDKNIHFRLVEDIGGLAVDFLIKTKHQVSATMGFNAGLICALEANLSVTAVSQEEDNPIKASLDWIRNNTKKRASWYRYLGLDEKDVTRFKNHEEVLIRNKDFFKYRKVEHDK